MTVSITISRKMLVVTVLVGLLFGGASLAFANHDPNIVHACLNKNGSITVVDEAEDCKNPDDAIALATQAAIDLLQAQADDLQTQVDANTATLTHFSTIGNDIFITGANLHVVNGTGTTFGAVNGLGNVIIGYNELRGIGNDRSGSHMLVVGNQNNYSSFGGIVVGVLNTTSGDQSSVSGGLFNTASGDQSSVSGGQFNTASGDQSSVSGGFFNTASGDQSSVSGGFDNTASGLGSSVSGGQFNTASGDQSSVSGGDTRTAAGLRSWAAGSLFEPN